MFRFATSEARQRSAYFHIGVFLIGLAFSSVARAQGDPEILWQTNNGGKVLAFSPSGKMLLAGTKLFAAADGTLLRDFVLPYNGSGPNAVALSPDEQYAAIGIQAFNQNLDVFRVADGSLLAGRISAHSNGTTSVAFSPDGQLLATGGRDGTAKIWHLPDMTLLRTLGGAVGYGPRVFAVAFSLDGGTLAVGGQGGVVLFRVSDGEPIRELVGAASTRTLAVSPDNQFLASGSDVIDQQGQCTDCAVKTWRISDGTLLQVIDTGNDAPLSIAFSRDEQVIAAGSGDRIFDGVVRFWRVSDGVLLRYFNQNPETGSAYVSGFAYSPDGNFFAFARADFRVVVARNPFASAKLGVGRH
ncbi:MAG TPA: hypothetical protein VK474_01160 [Chthoniobacterales bacterium]|nr:hypothetical protein [Chthoniobacterales bacterium]